MAHPESHSVQSQFTSSTGTDLETLAQQCRERYLQGHGEEVGVWDELDRNIVVKWMEAIDEAARFIVHAYSEEIQTTFPLLAKRFAGYYHAADRWDDLEKLDRICFEAAVRHLVNMVTAEDAEDVRDALAFDWAGWVASRKE